MSDTPSFSDWDKGTAILKQIVNPQAMLMRDKLRSLARRGEYPQTGCPHPFSALAQYEDDDPSVRRSGLPVNLYECTICHGMLWLVDPYGNEKPDG